MFLLFVTVILFCITLVPHQNVQEGIETIDFELPISYRVAKLEKISEKNFSVNFEVQEIKKAVKVLSASVDLDGLFSKYASEYGVDRNLLTKIADCESHFHQNSVNGDYAGMFQFSTGTWMGTRAQMGLDQNPDLRFSGEESIKTAAFKISRGGVSAWTNCSR